MLFKLNYEKEIESEFLEGDVKVGHLKALVNP